MGRRNQSWDEVTALLQGRPGWRLETPSTPGARPLWCYVTDGQIELSVAAEGRGISLYLMKTDQEAVFGEPSQLRAWLEEHRPDVLGDVPLRPGGRERLRKFFEWS